VALRRELRLRLRMSFTVMRSNIGALPRMMRLAQELELPLYLNLATDRTFLFRDAQVTAEASLDSAAVDAVLTEVEQVLRADSHGLPRPAELEYLREHFRDVVQTSVPCAESQLKLMVHSRGEVGGCWGHDTHANVRDTPLADIVDSERYRDDHTRFFRKDCAGCGSNYSFNLALRPRSYVDDLLWRTGRHTLARTSS
jgi:MoaA/NifB/PqqE/SkfB family radical SAM enzyme